MIRHRSPSRAYRAILFQAVLGSAASVAHAIDFSWQGSGGVPSGSWSQAANWSPAGGPPTAPHTAAITLLPGAPYVVTLDVNPSVASLTLDSAQATVAGAGRTITAPRVNLLNGTFTGTPTLSFGFGTPTFNLGSSFAGGFHTALGFGSRLTFTSANNTISPDRPFSLAVANVGAETVLNGQSGLINQSTISFGGAGSNARIQVPGTFVNQGVINASATSGGVGSSYLSADLDNASSGVINMFENTVLGFDGITSFVHVNRGVINVPVNRTCVLNGSSFEQNSGTMNVAGTLSNDIFGRGVETFRQTGGTIDFGPTSGGFRSAGQDCHVQLLAGSIIGNPTISFSNANGTLTIPTNGNHTGNFHVYVDNSTITVIADRLQPGRTVQLFPFSATTSLRAPDGFINESVITMLGNPGRSSAIVINGTLDNRAVLDAPAGNSVVELRCRLDNTGTINLGQDTFLGADTVGQPSTTYAHLNRGVITLAAGKTLQFLGSSFEHNSGTMIINGMTDNNQAGFGVETFRQTGGTIDFGSTGRMQFGFGADCNIVLQAGRINGTPTINFSVSNGTLTMTTDGSHTGDFNAFVSSGSLRLVADKLVAGRTVALTDSALFGQNGLTNQSRITMSGSSPASTTKIVVPGTLVNEGTISVQAAATNWIDAALNNGATGVLSVQHSLLLGSGSFAHINHGSISLAAGKTISINGVSFEQAGGAMTIASATLNNQSFAGAPLQTFLHTGGAMMFQQAIGTFTNLDYSVAGAAPALSGPQVPVVTTLDNSRLHATTLSIGSIGPARLDVLNTSTLDIASQILVGGNGTLNISPNSAADVGAGSASLGNTLTVSANGTLGGSGTVAVGAVQVGAGTVNVGTPTGILTITGSYSSGSASTLRTELAGVAPGDHDQLVVGGAATFDGTLGVGVLNAYNPAYLVAHAIVISPAVVGTFDQVTASQIASNKILAVTYDATHVFATAALPGDANLNGTTNISDFALLASHFNQPGPWVDGNFNQTGLIDIGDFALLAAFFNLSVPADAVHGSVPEPAAAMLLLMASALRRTRRATY